MNPLKGLRILEIGGKTSSAICGLILSDFGAQVIKIEASDVTVNDRCTYAAQNRGKKSVVLETSNPHTPAMLEALVKSCTAIVTDNTGLTTFPSLTYDKLKSRHPQIVYTSISGFGADGPYACRPSSDQTIQAESGIMSITGEKGGCPVVCGSPIADYLTGMMGCIATLMAIIEALQNGHGRFVDVSAMDTLLFGLENQFSIYLKTNHIPSPIGNNYQLSAPVGVFQCKDGSLTISVATQSQWTAFAEALGQTGWLSDPRFETVQSRIHNYEKLNEEVTKVFSQYTYDELIAILQSRHCIYGRLNNLHDVIVHPQILHRPAFVTASYLEGDSYLVPHSPLRINQLKQKHDFPVSSPGYDTTHVLNTI